MERLFLECAVRASLLVGATAIVLYAMRVKAATARHSVWAGVVALLLLLPIWTAWGPKALLRVLPPLAQNIANKATAPADIVSTGVLPSPLISPGQAVLLGVYLLGLYLLLFRLGIGTVRARRLVRNAVLHDNILTSSLCAAPVTVGFLHPKVIFPEHWREWSQGQLDAVLTHECAHVRRREVAHPQPRDRQRQDVLLEADPVLAPRGLLEPARCAAAIAGEPALVVSGDGLRRQRPAGGLARRHAASELARQLERREHLLVL